MVGLEGLEALPQPKGFCDSRLRTLFPSGFPHSWHIKSHLLASSNYSWLAWPKAVLINLVCFPCSQPQVWGPLKKVLCSPLRSAGRLELWPHSPPQPGSQPLCFAAQKTGHPNTAWARVWGTVAINDRQWAPEFPQRIFIRFRHRQRHKMHRCWRRGLGLRVNKE